MVLNQDDIFSKWWKSTFLRGYGNKNTTSLFQIVNIFRRKHENKIVNIFVWPSIHDGYPGESPVVTSNSRINYIRLTGFLGMWEVRAMFATRWLWTMRLLPRQAKVWRSKYKTPKMSTTNMCILPPESKWWPQETANKW